MSSMSSGSVVIFSASPVHSQVSAGGAVVVGLGVRPVLDLDERNAAGAERGALRAAIEHREPEHVAVIIGEPVEVAYLEADRADMQRGAARESGGGGGVGGVHRPYIGVSAGPRNGRAPGRGAGRVRPAPCNVPPFMPQKVQELQKAPPRLPTPRRPCVFLQFLQFLHLLLPHTRPPWPA